MRSTKPLYAGRYLRVCFRTFHCTPHRDFSDGALASSTVSRSHIPAGALSTVKGDAALFSGDAAWLPTGRFTSCRRGPGGQHDLSKMRLLPSPDNVVGNAAASPPWWDVEQQEDGETAAEAAVCGM